MTTSLQSADDACRAAILTTTVGSPVTAAPSSPNDDSEAPRTAADRDEREGEGNGAAPARVTSQIRRILIVDDNEDARDVLAEVVRDWGHETRVARDGAMALEQAELFKPHIVLLDLGLPDMTGHQVASRLRASPSVVRPFLVALTGYGEASDHRRSLASGFDRHLLKPPNLAELEQLLASDLRAL